MKKFVVKHTWAQEEYREFTIEAESLEQAEQIAQDYYNDGRLWEESYELGDILTDAIEVDHENQ
jgi:hypothetical protein